MTEKHEQLLAEVVAFAEMLGCKPGTACAYHDILPSEEKSRMSHDFSAAGLAVRLRADRRLWHPSGGCLLAMRSYGRRNADKGLILTRDNVARFIKEIRIPDGFTRAGVTCNRMKREGVLGYPNVQDHAEYYYSEFSRMFPSVPVEVVGHSFGSGDPFAVFDTEVFESLPDWREVISDWALEI